MSQIFSLSKSNVVIQSLVILIFFVLLLSLKLPFRELFETLGTGNYLTEQLAEFLTRSFLTLFCILILLKFRTRLLKEFSSFLHVKNLQALIIPIMVFAIIIFGRIGDFKPLSSTELTLLIFNSLAIGFTEEFIFRGTILPIWMKKTNNLYVGTLISSLLFGLFHYVNLFREPDNLDGVTSQVIFAFILGIFLAGLTIRTRNILLPSFIHALFNLAFSSISLDKSQVVEKANQNVESSYQDLILTLVIYAVIAGSGILMIWLDRRKKSISKEVGSV